MCDSVLERGNTFGVERQVNPIVDAVTGKHDIRFHPLEKTAEAFEKARTRKGPAGMIFFAQTGYGFTGKSEPVDIEILLRIQFVEIVGRERDISAPLRDTVAEKHDFLSRQQIHSLRRYAGWWESEG